MRTFPWRVSALLFGSGCCALIYQIAWLREFRLIFGASTAASAAVLAIFIGGLGLGGLLLGTRADSHPRPILLYAQLEATVAVSAALSPLLLALVRELYVLVGGTPRVGLVGGTIGRLVLSGLVLAIPTMAMGGTLPAAARGVTRQGDLRRQDVALLYALNALGAVAGCFIATFLLLETFGTRQTLWLAAAVNLLIAVVARQVDRSSSPLATDGTAAPVITPDAQGAPAAFVLLSSGVVGFVFFLMELVWYRMLGPLLGGTVFTFSLILAVALAGIGIGSLLYAFVRSERPPSLSGFGWSCLLEAGAIAAGYAVGDRLAVLALVLQPFSHATFAAQVGSWSVITAIVVLLPAVIAGYQFPLLIALFGQGRARLGRQMGLAYAANTMGAIAGSLAGGFGLMPWLGAPGAWRFAALSLVLLGVGAIVLSAVGRSGRAWIPQMALAAATLALLTTTGPTAVWRHTGIGAGRARITITSANQLKDWGNAQRRAILWDGDGTESSVALASASTGYAFIVNGKADGSARTDAGTQVMSGLLGPILNPRARRSLVIGLGTGSTAGWLGAIPAMERVDVVELEPLILDVARACHEVNHEVMQNPKVHIILGDARETLLTSRDKYDVISSEPSNPFRAGIASLFTREYYSAVNDRLNPDGLFIQWVQAYEIDSRTLRTLYATMAATFPYVETWETSLNDLVLIGAKHPATYRTSALAARIQEEPFKTALGDVWRAVDLTGFLGHYVAGDPLARAIAAAPNVDVNTDDRNVVEFGLARSVGFSASALTTGVRQLAAALHAERPPLDDPAPINWAAVDTAWISFRASEASTSNVLDVVRQNPAEAVRRVALMDYYQNDNGPAALRVWKTQTSPPRDPNELAMVADLIAQAGSDDALPIIDQLRAFNAGEADTLLGVLRFRQSKFDDAATSLERAFQEYRTNPWAVHRFKEEALDLAETVGSRSPALARRMFDALKQPFAVDAAHVQRDLVRASLTRTADFKGLCREPVGALERHVPWTAAFLSLRRDCYAIAGDARVDQATRDLIEFQSHESLPLGAGVTGPVSP